MAEDKKGIGMGILNAVPSVIGGLTNALGIGEKRQMRRQLEQQEKLQNLSIQGSKTMSDYNYNKELQMWKDTNWSAQVEEAKKAGLSTAWLMGKGGGSPASMNGGMSVGMGSAADAASTTNAGTNKAMALANLALLGAQKENIEADTANKEADAGNKNVDTGIKTVDLNVKKDTTEESKNIVRDTARKLFHEANITATNQVIQTNTEKAVTDKAIAEAVGAGLENDLTKGKINLTATQIKQIKEQIAQGWKGLEFQGTDKVTGKYIEELINAAKAAFKK